MGCDIHFYIETKVNDYWVYYDFRKDYQDGEYDDGSPTYDYSKMWDSPFYVGRNYNLFAMLANVRNGYGFAGIDTGDGFNPISPSKGFPTDISLYVLNEYSLDVLDVDDPDSDGSCSRQDAEKWIDYGSAEYLNAEKTLINGPDWHSASWLTVQELLDYDLTQATNQRGCVGRDEFKVFLDSGKPESWWGDSWGNGIKKVSNEQMEEILDIETDYTPTTMVQWQESYHDCAVKFWDVTVPELQKLGNPEDVRIVFWFDN